jgi:hypothetical protein
MPTSALYTSWCSFHLLQSFAVQLLLCAMHLLTPSNSSHSLEAPGVPGSLWNIKGLGEFFIRSCQGCSSFFLSFFNLSEGRPLYLSSVNRYLHNTPKERQRDHWLPTLALLCAFGSTQNDREAFRAPICLLPSLTGLL